MQETKTKEMCESMPKSLKMDAYSEARLAAAKHGLAAASTKFVAAKVSRSKGLGV